MADTPKDAATGNSEAAPKKKSKKLIIIIVVVLLLGGGAGGGFFYLRGTAATAKDEKSAKKSKPKDDEESNSEEGGKEKPKDGKSSAASTINSAIPDDEDVKKVVELQPFIVNLTDESEPRYLRLTLSIGLGESSGEEKPDEIFLTRVRNAILAVLTTKKSEEILTVEGKAALRKEILKAAQKASEEPHVLAIYITDFIVQM